MMSKRVVASALRSLGTGEKINIKNSVLLAEVLIYVCLGAGASDR